MNVKLNHKGGNAAGRRGGRKQGWFGQALRVGEYLGGWQGAGKGSRCGEPDEQRPGGLVQIKVKR